MDNYSNMWNIGKRRGKRIRMTVKAALASLLLALSLVPGVAMARQGDEPAGAR